MSAFLDSPSRIQATGEPDRYIQVWIARGTALPSTELGNIALLNDSNHGREVDTIEISKCYPLGVFFLKTQHRW